MSEITLEKVDKVRERTGISYAEAKHALEVNNGDILEALIYIENVKANIDEDNVETDETDETNNNSETTENKYETIEEFKIWLNGIIKQGNITRIKIKRENKVLVDVPINAGIAAGFIVTLLSPLLAVGMIATVVAIKLTIEITKEDGTVEVINRTVKDTAEDFKEKATSVAEGLKEKFSGFKNEIVNKAKPENKVPSNNETIYSYTVKFDEVDE